MYNQYKKKQLQYYLAVLEALAVRSTCDRAAVSAIIVKDKSIISTGYNGAPRGVKHCDELGHIMVLSGSKIPMPEDYNMNDFAENCVHTVHAELNAVLQAAKNGIPIYRADMFSLYKPCYRCMQNLIQSGIAKCYYFKEYKDSYQHYYENNQFCRFIKIQMKELECAE